MQWPYALYRGKKKASEILGEVKKLAQSHTNYQCHAHHTHVRTGSQDWTWITQKSSEAGKCGVNYGMKTPASVSWGQSWSFWTSIPSCDFRNKHCKGVKVDSTVSSPWALVQSEHLQKLLSLTSFHLVLSFVCLSVHEFCHSNSFSPNLKCDSWINTYHSFSTSSSKNLSECPSISIDN